MRDRIAQIRRGRSTKRPGGTQEMRKLRLAVFPLAVTLVEVLGTASAHGYLRTK